MKLVIQTLDIPGRDVEFNIIRAINAFNINDVAASLNPKVVVYFDKGITI